MPLRAGAITSEGAVQGKIAIENRDALPSVAGVDNNAATSISSQQWLTDAQIRTNLLKFLEAQKLAGQKWTAQQIAQKLDIPLSLAQVAVLNPIGESIDIPQPDLQSLTDGGSEVASEGEPQVVALAIPLTLGGGVAIAFAVVGTYIIINVSIQQPSGPPVEHKINYERGKSGDDALKELQEILRQGGESAQQQYESIKELLRGTVFHKNPEELTPKEKAQIRNLEGYKDKTAAEAIRARGGGQGQVKELETGYGEKTVAELAKLAAKGDKAAKTALKIIKQAGKKKQKYGGK